MSDQLSYLERVKIQTEILLPLFRRLREELGNERACELVRSAVREYAKSLGEAISAQNEGTPLEKLQAVVPAFSAGNTLEIEPIANTDKELSLNVRRCKYAEYFKSLGEPEFGAMLTCEIDPPMTEAISSDLTLERTQTIMRGGSHCDFRWKLD